MADKETIKIEFARRLHHALTQRGWSQSDLARRIGHKNEMRDNISGYVRGENMPRPPMMKKIADALGMKVEALNPALSQAPVETSPAMLSMEQLSATEVALRINTITTPAIAMQIQNLLFSHGKRTKK